MSNDDSFDFLTEGTQDIETCGCIYLEYTTCQGLCPESQAEEVTTMYTYKAGAVHNTKALKELAKKYGIPA